MNYVKSTLKLENTKEQHQRYKAILPGLPRNFESQIAYLSLKNLSFGIPFLIEKYTIWHTKALKKILFGIPDSLYQTFQS